MPPSVVTKSSRKKKGILEQSKSRETHVRLYTTRRTGLGTVECGRGRGSPTTDPRPHDGVGVDVEVEAATHEPPTSESTSVSVSVSISISVSTTSFCAATAAACVFFSGCGTPGAASSPRSQRARRSARPSIHGPALESTQPPCAPSHVQVPPSVVGRFSGGTRSRRTSWCWFVPRSVILSSVRGESHG